MRSFYKLDSLFLLKNAIIKRNYDCSLTDKEKEIYDFYEDGCTYSEMFEKVFLEYFEDWYRNKEERLLDEEQSKLEDLLIFRSLVHFLGKTVSLKELYEYGLGKYFNIYNLNIEEDRERFLERINGCLGETKVSVVKGFSCEGIKLPLEDIERLKYLKKDSCSDLKVEISDKKNPLVFISGLLPNPVKKFNVSDGKYVLLSLSDLHLGGKLVSSVGDFFSSDLEEYLDSFVAFKKQLLEDLSKQGINVNMIVMPGDIIDGFCGLSVDKSDDEFLKKSRKRYVEVINRYNLNTSGSLKFKQAVGYVAGNHDETLGLENFLSIMQEFGDNALYLGSGACYIKINNEYVLLSHPNSLDWGLPIERDSFKNRRAMNKDLFHFEEYFKLCLDKFEYLKRKNLFSALGNTPEQRVAILTRLVNDELKIKNPNLYELYKPFITIGNVSFKSCFESVIKIEEDDFNLGEYNLTVSDKVKHGFGLDRFIGFCKKNSNIMDMIVENNKILLGNGLVPTVGLVGHFHTKLNAGKKVSYAKQDENGLDLLPVLVEEGCSFEKDADKIYSSTICSLEIKDSFIDSVSLEPIFYRVNKDGLGYSITKMNVGVKTIYKRKNK